MKSIKRLFLSMMCLVSILSVTPYALAENTIPININTATAEELQQIKGIGETRAQAIIAYRDQHGSFAKVEDLLEVKGLGESILTRNQNMLVVD